MLFLIYWLKISQFWFEDTPQLISGFLVSESKFPLKKAEYVQCGSENVGSYPFSSDHLLLRDTRVSFILRDSERKNGTDENAPPPAMHTPQARTPPEHTNKPPPHTPPPVNRMTNRCKNITLPQTSFAGGNNECYDEKFQLHIHIQVWQTNKTHQFAPDFVVAECKRTFIKHNNHAKWIRDLSMYVILGLYEISTVPSCFVTSIIPKIS